MLLVLLFSLFFLKETLAESSKLRAFSRHKITVVEHIKQVCAIRHLFNYTNQMHTIYSIHICTILLLHVSVYLTSSSGRTYVFLTQNQQLLQSYCLWYSTLVALVYSTFTMVKYLLHAILNVTNPKKICNHCKSIVNQQSCIFYIL